MEGINFDSSGTDNKYDRSGLCFCFSLVPSFPEEVEKKRRIYEGETQAAAGRDFKDHGYLRRVLYDFAAYLVAKNKFFY